MAKKQKIDAHELLLQNEELLREFSEPVEIEIVTEKPKTNPKILPTYLKDIIMSDGTDLYTAVLDIARKLLDGVDFVSACKSAGQIPTEIGSMMLVHRSVSRALNLAEGENMAWWVSKLKGMADRDWKVPAYYLERRYPDVFAEVKCLTRKNAMPNLDASAIENSGTNNIDVKKLTDDELLALTLSKE